jgi:hypothetical protein
MKKLLVSVLLSVGFLVFSFNSILAISLYGHITQLPEYKNTDTFKLSYTALQVGGQPITAQFWYMKEGDVWRYLGSAITGTTGQVEANGSYLGSDAKYFFKVDISSNGETVTDVTSTIVDRNAPGAPSEYSKERIANNAYRLSWRTPNNDDFSYVAVYRSKDQNFTADGGTLVAQIGGAKDTKITWNDSGLEIDKDYFYALRSVDKAGNASGVVGDGGTTTILQATPTSGSATGNVNLLPKENTGGTDGQILGGETENLTTPTPESQTGLPGALGQATKTVSDMGTGQKILLVVILLGLLGGGYYFFKNKSSE